MYGWCKVKDDIVHTGQSVRLRWLDKKNGAPAVDPVARQYILESVIASAMTDLVRRYQDAKGSLMDAEISRTFKTQSDADELARWQAMFMTRKDLAESRNRVEHPGPAETLAPGSMDSSRYLLFRQVPLQQKLTSADDVVKKMPRSRGPLAKQCFKIESYSDPVSAAAEKANILSTNPYFRHQLKKMFGTNQANILWNAVSALDVAETGASEDQRSRIKSAIKTAMYSRLDCDSTEFGVVEDSGAKINYEEENVEPPLQMQDQHARHGISESIFGDTTDVVAIYKRAKSGFSAPKPVAKPKDAKTDEFRFSKQLDEDTEEYAKLSLAEQNKYKKYKRKYVYENNDGETMYTKRYVQEYQAFKRAKLREDAAIEAQKKLHDKYTEESARFVTLNMFLAAAEVATPKILSALKSFNEYYNRSATTKLLREKLIEWTNNSTETVTINTDDNTTQLQDTFPSLTALKTKLAEGNNTSPDVIKLLRETLVGLRVRQYFGSQPDTITSSNVKERFKTLALTLLDDMAEYDRFNLGKDEGHASGWAVPNGTTEDETMIARQEAFVRQVQLWDYFGRKPAKRVCGYELIAGTPVQVSRSSTVEGGTGASYPKIYGWDDNVLYDIKDEFLAQGSVDTGESLKRKAGMESSAVAYDGVGRPQSAWFAQARFKAYYQGVNRKRKAGGQPEVDDFDYTGANAYANVEPIPTYEETAVSFSQKERKQEEIDVVRLVALCISGDSKSVKYYEPDPLSGMPMSDRWRLLNPAIVIDTDKLCETERVPAIASEIILRESNPRNIRYSNVASKYEYYAAMRVAKNKIVDAYNALTSRTKTGYYFAAGAELESQHTCSDAAASKSTQTTEKVSTWDVGLMASPETTSKVIGAVGTKKKFAARWTIFTAAFIAKARFVEMHVQTLRDWKHDTAISNMERTSSAWSLEKWHEILNFSDMELIRTVFPFYFKTPDMQSYYAEWAYKTSTPTDDEVDLTIWDSLPVVQVAELVTRDPTKSLATDIRNFLHNLKKSVFRYATTLNRQNPFGYNNFGQSTTSSVDSIHARMISNVRDIRSSFAPQPGFTAKRTVSRTKVVPMCAFPVKPFSLRDGELEDVLISELQPCGFSEAVVEPLSTDEVAASLNLAEGCSNLQNIFETADTLFVRNVIKEYNDLNSDTKDIVLVPIEQNIARCDVEVYINERDGDWVVGSTPSLLTCAAHVSLSYLLREFEKTNAITTTPEHQMVKKFYDSHDTASQLSTKLRMQQKIYNLKPSDRDIESVAVSSLTTRFLHNSYGVSSNPAFSLSVATMLVLETAGDLSVEALMSIMFNNQFHSDSVEFEYRREKAMNDVEDILSDTSIIYRNRMQGISIGHDDIRFRQDAEKSASVMLAVARVSFVVLLTIIAIKTGKAPDIIKATVNLLGPDTSIALMGELANYFVTDVGTIVSGLTTGNSALSAIDLAAPK